MKPIGLVVVLLALSTCGGDSNDTVKGYCDSICHRRERCWGMDDGETQATCASECEAQGEGLASTFKAGVLGNMGECLDALACEFSEATCTQQTLAKVNPSWTTDPDYQACATRAAVCIGESSSDVASEYLCEFFILRTGTVTSGLKACLAKDCAEISECIHRVIDPDGH